jgi:hypothetical protein
VEPSPRDHIPRDHMFKTCHPYGDHRYVRCAEALPRLPNYCLLEGKKQTEGTNRLGFLSGMGTMRQDGCSLGVSPRTTWSQTSFFLDRVYVRTTLKESHLSFALLGELKVHHGQANLEVVCSAQSAIFLVGWQ